MEARHCHSSPNLQPIVARTAKGFQGRRTYSPLFTQGAASQCSENRGIYKGIRIAAREIDRGGLPYPWQDLADTVKPPPREQARGLNMNVF